MKTFLIILLLIVILYETYKLCFDRKILEQIEKRLATAKQELKKI